PPDCGGYTPAAFVPDDFAAARKLLAEAGYPGGHGLPVFNVLSFDTGPALRMLQAVQAGWAGNLGVRMTITPQEFKTLFQNQQDGNYTIAFSGWIADYPDPLTFLGMMVTGGGNNYAGWSDRTYDHLLDLASRTADGRRRFGYFQAAEAILLRKAPVIPLYYNSQIYLKQPYVRHWLPSVLNFHRFADVYLQR
ncbi:MAG: ABC transporter substrate-binding protein, partial [Opitutaceae bacterium]